MGLTEEEADFLDSLPALASTYPPLLPLKRKEPRPRLRFNSLGSHTSSYKYPSNLTGPPSPSVLSNTAGPISSPGTNLASSLWPQKGGSPYPSHLSTLSSSTSPEPGSNSEGDAEEAGSVCLPPISPSRVSGPSESLPSLIPRPSTSPTPSTPSAPLAPPTPSKTSPGRTPFLLRPLTEWGSTEAPSNQNRKEGKETIWTAIRNASVPIYLRNPTFDGESRPHICA